MFADNLTVADSRHFEHPVFSPDGRDPAAVAFRSLVVWDWPQKKLYREFSCARRNADRGRVLVDKYGATLVSTAGFVGIVEGVMQQEFAMRLWDRKTGKLVRKIPLKLPVGHVAFTPSNRCLITTGNEGCLVWDAAIGRKLCSLDAGLLDRPDLNLLSAYGRQAARRLQRSPLPHRLLRRAALWYSHRRASRVPHHPGSRRPAAHRVRRLSPGG